MDLKTFAELWSALNQFLAFLKPTEEGAKRRAVNRRFGFIQGLDKDLKKGRITREEYEARIKAYDENYQ
jgi:hypothetical protein